MVFARTALVCAVAALSTACTAILLKMAAPEHGDEIVVPRYVVRPLPTPWKPASLIAGAGRVDITPPPGFPTGGHGPAGSVARGTLTRLYARAFFFADTDGNALVLVSCELFAIPGGLSASVARNVAIKWAQQGIVLPPEAVIIAATHTHQSPGNYLTAQTYNAFASSYPGFSPALFDFLVEQVSSAVNKAIANALANGAATLTIRSAPIEPWLQLNRSPRTFLLNADAQAMMNALNPARADDPRCQPGSERGEATRDWDLVGCPRLRAVDRTMTIVDVARGSETVGLLVFFALHPTVLDHGASLFSSDALGLATRAVETAWSPQPPREPVVGFFNGAEGDVVARRGWRDAREVHSVASQLSAEMLRIGRLSGTPIGGTIAVKRKIAGSDVTCAPGISLASRPMVGAPALGGGEDDRTAAHRLGWVEGIRDVARNGHGVKHPALDPQLIRMEPITEKLAPTWTFPARLPVTVVRLGSLTLGALPVEVSTATGVRIRRAMADAGAQGRVELVGMADEYAGYVATPEEYAAQDYMGASTLWGPNQGPFMACLSAEAFTTVATTHKEKPVPEQRFDPGEDGDEQDPKVLFGPAAVYERRSAPDEELEHVLLTRDHVPARYLPYFEWTEAPADASEEFKFTERRQIRVTRVSDGRSWLDDRGEFAVVLREAPQQRTFQWAAIWLGPILGTLPATDRFQFHITVPQPGGGTVTVSSCPFSVDATSSPLRPPIPPC